MKKLTDKQRRRHKAAIDKAYRLRKKREAQGPQPPGPQRNTRGEFATSTGPKVTKRPQRPLGPSALAKQAARKTDRARPGERPGEDERIAIRREQAMAARVQGATFRQIADELNCSIATAYEDIAAELAGVNERTRQSTEEYRTLELARCDLILRGYKQGVIKGDPPSGRVFLKAVEVRAKMLGLIKPSHIRPGDEQEEVELSEREVAGRVAALAEFARTPRRGGPVH